MNDQTRYAFCIEMAKMAERYNDLDRMNHWYARAWHYLRKAESDDNPTLNSFPSIEDRRDA